MLYHYVGKNVLTLMMSLMTRRFERQRLNAKKENSADTEKIANMVHGKAIRLSKTIMKRRTVQKFQTPSAS